MKSMFSMALFGFITLVSLLTLGIGIFYTDMFIIGIGALLAIAALLIFLELKSVLSNPFSH